MKKLLIYLSLLFSMFLFLFIPGVKASGYNNADNIVPFNSDDSGFLNLNLKSEDIEEYISTLNLDSSLDGYIFFVYPVYDRFEFNLFIFSKTIAEDRSLMIRGGNSGAYIGSKIVSYGSTPFTGYYISNSDVIYRSKQKDYKTFNDFVFSKSISSFTNGNGVYLNSNTNTINKPIYYYSNVNIYNEYTSQNIESSKPKSYNVTFHLNGGNVLDKNIVNDNIVGNKYEDYTTTIQSDKIYEYITNMEFKKDGMDFKGLYYDEKLTLKFNLDQYSEITGDRDFYLKFIYKDVEDFLKNTTFNTYTFNTDYEYAIISLNSKTNKDIYLGLNYIDYSLEIYKYLKNDNEYKQNSVKCLIPYYSKDNKYYYWLESPLDNDYEVLVLPKEKFKDNNYEFLLSNNAYVSYTNDLTKVIIKNDDGQDIETNLESSYNYSQDALLNNENDIIEIFKKLAENKNNNVFSYFNQIWNYIKRSKLYTYLLTLIIGSLIILIIHVAKR